MWGGGRANIPGAWCCCLGSSVFQVEAPGLKTASLDAGSGGCSLHRHSSWLQGLLNPRIECKTLQSIPKGGYNRGDV